MKNILLLTGSILVTLLLLESYFRIFPYQKMIVNNPYQYTEIKGDWKPGLPLYTMHQVYPLKYDHNNYYAQSGGLIAYHHDQFGGRWISSNKRNLKEITSIFLGDSFTYGFGVRYSDSYVYKLEKSISDELQNISIINLATPGGDAKRHLSIYQSTSKKIKHELVFCGLHINDLIRFPTSSVINDIHIKPNYSFSKLLNFIHFSISYYLERKKNIAKILDPTIQDDSFFQENLAALIELNDVCKHRNKNLYVVLLPILLDLNSSTFEPLYSRIKIILQKHNIKYLDLTSSLSIGQVDSKFWILPFDQHPNEEANRIFANSIKTKLRDDLATLKRQGERK